MLVVNGDQSAVNRNCYKLLGACENDPYFFIDESKIYAIFDVPHLVKSCRTTFLKDDLQTVDGKVSGESLKKAFKASRESCNGLFVKLTTNHFEYDTFQKMRVGLAVQVLSNSVANDLQKMIELGYFKGKTLQQTAYNTSKFIQNMNKIFDLLNSKSITDANINKRGICSQNIEQLRELQEYVSSIEKCSGSTVYWIRGMNQTLKGVIDLCTDELRKNSNFHLMSRYLNQDPLENLFGTIRAKGVNNRNPSLMDFLRIVGRIMTSKLEVNLKETNCEVDDMCKIQVVDLIKYEKKAEILDEEVQEREEIANFTVYFIST